MAFPPQYRESPPSLPSILSSGPGRYNLHHNVQFSGSPAISIPGLDPKDDVPPPLPPPRHLPCLEGATNHEESKNDPRDYGRISSSTHSGRSGYGSMHPGSFVDERSSYSRRGTRGSINGDEGYASYSATERFVAIGSTLQHLDDSNSSKVTLDADLGASNRDSRPTEFLHHSKFHFQTAADLHGDSMKKKLDPIRTFDRSPQAVTSSALSELVRRQPDPRAPTLSLPVQLPIHTRPALDSPTKMTDTPIFSAVSPRSASLRHFPGEHRLAKNGVDYDQSPRGRSCRNNSDDASSTHGSYEFAGAEDMEMDEATSPKRLHPDEAHATVGHKRRAASPPTGDYFIHGGPSDGRRRELGSRGSPTPRLTVIPQASSLSSAAVSRSNSYISTMSMAPSSATTATSFSRRSPGAASPGGVSPTSCNSPYTTPASLNQSPRNSISGRANTHGRTVSGTSTSKLADMQKPTGPKVQRVLMCECCPKKPKKFDTADELRYVLIDLPISLPGVHLHLYCSFVIYFRFSLLIVKQTSVLTRPRNNTSVHSAGIVSRTRMKPSGTRIRFTFDGIRGHVQHCPVMIGHSMIRQAILGRPTPVAIVVMSFPDQVEALEMVPCPEGSSPSTPQTMTGMIEFATYKKCTNSENATRPKSFTELIISGNI
ncbi:hypothetical protein ED733_008893 [Metarhizium rileyi]|uniref:C2H2-type zinc finger ascomycetes domain-containing protein n=1 Tax=Metarhizium rileyi (strain RCEF 4871) TaxID=1649241 RepID=A0A5C6GKL7_METRR|nr:hypothetical protein ED733_008893 [Metarhizium rileyi]